MAPHGGPEELGIGDALASTSAPTLHLPLMTPLRSSASSTDGQDFPYTEEGIWSQAGGNGAP